MLQQVVDRLFLNTAGLFLVAPQSSHRLSSDIPLSSSNILFFILVAGLLSPSFVIRMRDFWGLIADKLREAAKTGRKEEALRLLQEAKEWDPANKVIDLELEVLRKGIAPRDVDSMELAELVWAPSRDMRFVITPPASPGTEAGKVFVWGGVLEQEIDGRYLVKVGREYQFCFTSDFPLKGINYNAGVRVVGEYRGNVTFSTIFDAPVEVPCLKALYVE